MIQTTRKALAALAVVWGGAAPAFAWDAEGHRAIGIVATENLSPAARAQVVKILGNDDLGAIASWMDDLRSAFFHAGPLAQDAEALRFNAIFRKNGQWHYVDLPLGLKAYELDGPFSRLDDVVHMIETAVSVLEGRGDPQISKREALYMLVHFVGDEHQPMHIGNGFFKVEADGKVQLVIDPAAAKDLPDDKGGNADFYGPGKYDELHAYWDTNLVQEVAGTKDATVLAGALEKKVIADGAKWKTPGDPHHWPEAWATESLVAARTAYDGITFGAETPDPRGGIKSIKITFPAHYDEVCTPVAAERLAQAGVHLAEILNAVQWSE